MRRFWSWLGLNLGKHWITVIIVLSAVTIFFAYGTTKLEFSTGQENYLNKSDQIYKDNVAYQDLFGGEAMVSLVTMDKGHTVAELFTAENIAKWQAAEAEIRNSHKVQNVVSPLTALQWNDNLIKGPNGNPSTGVAGTAIVGAIGRTKNPKAQALRTADATKTLQRVERDPAGGPHARQPALRRLLAVRQHRRSP